MNELIKKYYERRTNCLDRKYYDLEKQSKNLKKYKKDADDKGNVFFSFLLGVIIKDKLSEMFRSREKISNLELKDYKFGGLK